MRYNDFLDHEGQWWHFMPHIVDYSVDKGNVDPQSASDQLCQQNVSHTQMDFAIGYHDVDASAVEIENDMLPNKMFQKYVYDTST